MKDLNSPQVVLFLIIIYWDSDSTPSGMTSIQKGCRWKGCCCILVETIGPLEGIIFNQLWLLKKYILIQNGPIKYIIFLHYDMCREHRYLILSYNMYVSSKMFTQRLYFHEQIVTQMKKMALQRVRFYFHYPVIYTSKLYKMPACPNSLKTIITPYWGCAACVLTSQWQGRSCLL